MLSYLGVCMNENAALIRDDFWKILFFLEELKSPIKLVNFLEQNDITKDEFYLFIEKANAYGLTLNFDESEHESFVISPLVWHKDFGDILLENSDFKELAKDIQIAVNNSRTVNLEFIDQSQMTVFPWRVLFMNNSLGIIGEDIESKKIVSIELSQVRDIELLGDDYVSMYARLEIEEFIHAMRVVEGSDERIVLKIHHGKSISMPSELMFLGHPYTTTNQYGDIIWAASVEKSQYLFEWLYSIKDCVEILDPTVIISEFQEFVSQNKKAA